MERYDIAVIGTGPAGVSAAITSKVRNKSVILFGSKDLSAKLAKAHTILNYPGFPEAPGAEIGAAFSRHLDAMGIEITEDKINAVYSMGDYFALQGGENAMYEAKAVIIASGVVAGKPLPGEEELLGRGVSYCATCDAALYRGKSAAVCGFSPKEEHEASFLAEIADKVYYIPVYKKDEPAPAFSEENIEVLNVKPLGIEKREGRKVALRTDGDELVTDGVFILRDSVAPGQLVPGLEVEGAHIKVARDMSTNIAGCFACGDITGTPYQYVKAAGEGNVAALSAVSYIDKSK